MTLADLPPPARFRSSSDVADALRAACETNPDLAACTAIGQSEEGREILGITLGHGPRVVTLVAGAHADEPVGPETLRTLVLEGLAARGWGADPDGEGTGLEGLFSRFTFRIVPHVNPDGEAANRPWVERWAELGSDPSAALASYLVHRRREPPGRDVEFGYPAMRTENKAATGFLFDGGPVALHASLHGMGFSEGALVLVERAWLGDPRADRLVAGFLDAARGEGLRPHDHDREGDKGFAYGGPGVWSTPRGRAMQAHFRARGDDATAARFHLSSMEMAVAGGGAPLCIVPELPLFVIDDGSPPTPGVASMLARFRDRVPELTLRARRGESLASAVERFGLRTVPLGVAVRLQLRLLELALDAVAPTPPPAS